MNKFLWMTAAALSITAAAWLMAADKIDAKMVNSGKAAIADAATLKPGTARKITAADLAKPFETKSATNFPQVIPRPEGMMPQAPAGFKVELYASGLAEPRQIRTAPNGDLFFTEKRTGELKVARGYKDGKAEQISVFATGLDRPFGIAFYPAGNNPQWVYAGNAGSVVRFAYKTGDLKATGAAEVVAKDVPIKTGPGDFHDTRDLSFSKDGKSLFVSVGSGSNIDDPDKVPEDRRSGLEEWARLLISALSKSGAHEKMFRVDTQLRPHGGQGPLIASTAHYDAYFRNEASGWELQAWLKAALADWTVASWTATSGR